MHRPRGATERGRWSDVSRVYRPPQSDCVG